MHVRTSFKKTGCSREWERASVRFFWLLARVSTRKNLKPLAGEDCFSISNFYLHNDIQTINPAFHGFTPYHEPQNSGKLLHKTTGYRRYANEKAIF
jgi:hypothetical protein